MQLALRILHLSPFAPSAWGGGGIPRVVAAQTQALSLRGHEITIAATDAGLGRAEKQPTASNELIFPNLSGRLARNFQFFTPLGFSAFLRAHTADFDLLHIHSHHHLPGVLAARHFHRAGKPIILQPNGTALRIERRRAAKWLFDTTLGRRLLPTATCVIAVSAAERAQFHQLGISDERIRDIPNPLLLADFEGIRPRASGAGKARLIYLGQLSPRKRVDLCIRALSEIGEARLVLAGPDMGEGPRLRRMVRRLGLEKRVDFIGVLEGKRRLEELADADLMLYPTENEIFGLAPLESILCGTPVIVSDDCGAGEIISRIGGGQVIPCGNPEALTEAIRNILSGKCDIDLESAAVAIRRKFSAERVAEELEKLYLEVLR